jgi:predicted permease
MSFLRDVHYSLRQIRRQPGLPLIIVLTLGLAMGISTSLFTVINGSWFALWPVRGAQEMRIAGDRIAPTEWQYWHEHAQSFSGLAATGASTMRRLGGNRVQLEFVSSNYFQVLQMPLLVGAGFSAADDTGTAGNIAIISHELWQARFAGDPKIIGRTLVLDPLDPNWKSASPTVIGVAARGFDGLGSVRTHLWLPLSAWRQFAQPTKGGETTIPRVVAFGRLAQGASDRQAQAELSVLRQRFYASSAAPPHVVLRTTDRYSQSTPTPQTRGMLISLLVGVAFITLIACANVANLLLARGHSRRGEIALRLSLGASRAQVIRQFLVESSLLSLAAAWVGVMIAMWLPEAVLKTLIQSTSSELAGMIRVNFPFDRHVFLWALAMAVTACVGFGLVPALRSATVGLSELLKESHGMSKPAILPSLLSYQTIVSVMALAIAGLMLRSSPVREARAIGRAAAGLTVMRVTIPPALNGTERLTLVTQISEELSAVSGQPVAGLTGQIQYAANQSLHVTPEYFTIMRTPWVAGRTFTREDAPQRVMIVNEAFARHYWPAHDALGQTLARNQGPVWDQNLLGRQVIGIVRNGPFSSPTAYVPAAPDSVRTFLVRAPSAHLRREVPSRVARLNPGVTTEVMSGSQWIAPIFGPSSVAAWIIVGFGAAALLLGSIGFFSLLDYAVQHRTREIGIRRALGAHTWDVVRSIVEPTTRPLLRGLLIGSVGAMGTGVFMQRAQMPAGVNPLDPITYVTVAAALVLAAVVASCAPARRALRIAPADALRVE